MDLEAIAKEIISTEPEFKPLGFVHSHIKQNKSEPLVAIKSAVDRMSELYDLEQHQDSKPNQGNVSNIRVHIPMVTNEQCFFQFWNGRPEANTQSIVRSYHMEVGKAYEVNTSNYHSAVNFGTEFRYHLIGVKYV